MLIIGLLVIVILALVMSFFVFRNRRANRHAPTFFTPPAPPDGVRLSRELQDEMRDIASRGNPEQAAKQLRKRASLSDTQASGVIYALQAGQVLPEPEPEPEPASTATETTETLRAPVDAELLATLRRLVLQDRLRRTAAMRLLKERTGMNTREARRFLDAL